MLVVIALGGNALLQRGQPMTEQQQRANVKKAAKALAEVVAKHTIVITHGNGPQVGLLALQSVAYTEVEPYPLDALGAQTEGMIGYLIEQELGNVLPYEQHIATVLTMIEVDPNDPAFHKPSKLYRPGRILEGVEAVIDKDRAGALLAQELGADAYLMLTDVQAVYTNWGKPDARAIRRTSPEAIDTLNFAAGSMGPKVEAACDFVRKTGGIAAIGSLDETLSMLQGTAGTTFAADVEEIVWYE